MCTLGPALERRVSELFAQRRASLAMALDELGNELLFDISRRAQDRMQAEASRRGLSHERRVARRRPRAGAGCAGRRAAPGRAPTASASAWAKASLMHPLKSTSMVLGVGVDLPASAWSRCDTCNSRDKCGVRSRALAAAATA